ncbi:1302_t:CDS:2 [Paraglomus brasilianum]|uniref:1302_t:CDS:1 n=1 Tax=Paraglomus brasilianum TaxID=144538 RepID=A0A9N9D3M2_9GLOM|nr:1302_t:CDS:2 [Paraglomus brasilianum]
MSNPTNSHPSQSSFDSTNSYYQSTLSTPRMTTDTDDERMSIETVKGRSYQNNNKRKHIPRKTNDDWSKRSFNSKLNKERRSNTGQFSEDDTNPRGNGGGIPRNFGRSSSDHGSGRIPRGGYESSSHNDQTDQDADESTEAGDYLDDNEIEDDESDNETKIEDMPEVPDKDDAKRTPFQRKLFYFFESPRGRAAKMFTAFNALCIVGTIVMICIDTLPTFATSDNRTLWLCIDAIVIATFSIEYLGRFFASVHKLRFFFRPLNLIDLISIAPFYVQIFIQRRPESAFSFLRILRLIRIIRLFDFARRSEQFKVTVRAIKRSTNQIFMVSFWFFTVLLFSSGIIYFLERGIFDEQNKIWFRVNPESGQVEKSPFQSIVHSFYWSVVTLTTTGYGDAIPYTSWGKFFAGVTMTCGILVIAMPTSIIGSSFVAEWTLHQRAQFLAKLKKNRQLVKNSDESKMALALRAKLLRKQNEELVAVITEVQEKLSDVNPTRYYQRYKNLQIQYENALAKISALEASLEKWRRLARNYEKFNDYRQRRYSRSGDSEDNGEKNWLSNKTIYGLRYPFRRTPTGFSTDDDTIDNDQSIKEKISSATETMASKSKDMIKNYTPNPFKLLSRFSRTLSLSNNDTSKFPESGISKSNISLPFNRRPLTRPVPSVGPDYTEYDHPESVMTTPDSITARALVDEMHRSSTLTNEERGSNKPSISSNVLADLFRRREAVGGSNSLKTGIGKKREYTAEDDILRSGDKGKSIVWIDNDTTNNNKGSAEIDIVIDSGIYSNGQSREDNNYAQSDKQLNETRTDSSIFYDPLHDQTKFESPPSD